MKKYFTMTHEWVEIKDGIARVGLSDSALKEIGQIVYVELPHIGSEVQAQDTVVVLESTKAAIDIGSPVGGTIVSVNQRVKEDPSLLSALLESQRWFFEIKVSCTERYTDLLTEKEYEDIMQKSNPR